MFSKQDYSRYFDQIACLERQKIHRLKDVLLDLDDAYIARVLEGQGADALRRYNLILDILQTESLVDSGADKRLVNRRSALGKVGLVYKDKGKLQELQAYCVNLTHQGLCFESEHKVVTGTQYEVRISLYDQPETMRSSGKIAWVKETFPGWFTAGIQFDV